MKLNQVQLNMFGKKITKTEDRKWLVKNIYFHTSTVFIIGFMCLITTGSSLFVTSSGNDISVVNMHIKDNAVQDISITIDSTYTAISGKLQRLQTVILTFQS